jgi:bifunctional non-homologous end joining protein LigD
MSRGERATPAQGRGSSEMNQRAGPSNPDKLLWPEAGVTKQGLWDYYEAAADRLLAQLADRPLTFKRFPNGVDAQGFFQKNLQEGAPEHLGRFESWAESSDRTVTYAVARRVEDLQWCAQIAALVLQDPVQQWSPATYERQSSRPAE